MTRLSDLDNLFDGKVRFSSGVDHSVTIRIPEHVVDLMDLLVTTGYSSRPDLLIKLIINKAKDEALATKDTKYKQSLISLMVQYQEYLLASKKIKVKKTKVMPKKKKKKWLSGHSHGNTGKRAVSPELQLTIRQEYYAGASYRELSIKYGYSINTITRAIKEKGYTKTKRKQTK